MEHEFVNKTIGLIGSGMIGGAVARLAVAAGLDVVLSNSRGPETLTGLVAELGERARAATPNEAAGAGDLVVATIPLRAYERLPAAALAGKIVIDTMNYNLERDGRIAELDGNGLTSSALLQRHLAHSRVVKTFNTIVCTHLLALARPSGAADRSALPIAGDDAAPSKEAADLLDALGYDAVYIGSLGNSWRIEPGSPAFVLPYLPDMPDGLARDEAERWFFETPGLPAPADRIKHLVDSAVRVPAGGSFDKFAGS
jgi:8-hydroxy-5-deazaflavin:NADPH oxidoreductase